MQVLLVSSYELGHQPLHLASPAAALRAAGHTVECLDISVQPWDPVAVDGADAVCFSVPMHTAMRLAVEAAGSVKRRRPGLPVCFYGLYAPVSREMTTGGLADHVVAGEYERGLVQWIDALAAGTGPRPDGIDLRRGKTHLPVRGGLPPLSEYARLAVGPEERLAGYVEATHGCAHRCRHCPVPVVYDGRTRKVDVDIVLDDVAQLVEAGAEHITFGDPDFLNRWSHAMQVTDELHRRFPHLTYDITTKIEHILRYDHLLGDLARTGCLFAVSAFECVNDQILRYLDKGHTAAEAGRAVGLLRSVGIEVRPSWLPFMPWTTVEDVADIVDFVVGHDLVGNVDPVQYTIKLLIPEGSLMLQVPQIESYLGGYDAENLTYTWRAADPRTPDLQRRLSQLVEDRQSEGASIAEIFGEVRDACYEAAGRPPGEPVREVAPAPRLTEPWYCCAEPTDAQFESIGEPR